MVTFFRAQALNQTVAIKARPAMTTMMRPVADQTSRVVESHMEWHCNATSSGTDSVFPVPRSWREWPHCDEGSAKRHYKRAVGPQVSLGTPTASALAAMSLGISASNENLRVDSPPRARMIRDKSHTLRKVQELRAQRPSLPTSPTSASPFHFHSTYLNSGICNWIVPYSELVDRRLKVEGTKIVPIRHLPTCALASISSSG